MITTEWNYSTYLGHLVFPAHLWLTNFTVERELPGILVRWVSLNVPDKPRRLSNFQWVSTYFKTYPNLIRRKSETFLKYFFLQSTGDNKGRVWITLLSEKHLLVFFRFKTLTLIHVQLQPSLIPKWTKLQLTLTFTHSPNDTWQNISWNI